MRIQAANTYFTGTYSILNSNNGSSFPYAMKVDGLGNFGNQIGRASCRERVYVLV